MSRGLLIVLEGPEGAGKTTQLRRLAARLTRAGVAHACFHEPGATALGSEIRRLLLASAHDMAPRAEALLFMASRAELVSKEITPAIAAGRVVLLDRFFLSTYAYQSVGRGLQEAEVRAANRLATGGLVPDLTLLLSLPAGAGLARADERGARDRMERAGDDFHARVAAAFDAFADPGWQRAHPECGPIVRVDATGTPDEVEGRVASALAARWPESFAWVHA